MNINFIIRELKDWQLRWNPLLLTNWPFSHNPLDLLTPVEETDESLDSSSDSESDELESLNTCCCIIL